MNTRFNIERLCKLTHARTLILATIIGVSLATIGSASPLFSVYNCGGLNNPACLDLFPGPPADASDPRLQIVDGGNGWEYYHFDGKLIGPKWNNHVRFDPPYDHGFEALGPSLHGYIITVVNGDHVGGAMYYGGDHDGTTVVGHAPHYELLWLYFDGWAPEPVDMNARGDLVANKTMCDEQCGIFTHRGMKYAGGPNDASPIPFKDGDPFRHLYDTARLITFERINDAGQVLGYLVPGEGYTGAPTHFVLTPVPEPSTLILLGTSLLVIALARKKLYRVPHASRAP